MANLEELKAAADAAAAKVVELKKAGAGADEVKAAVASLLAAKTEYAANNGGIGPDGKPFDPNASKKDKKKKEKDPNAAASNAQANAPTAESLAKKAAKKAEKDAKKAAAKAGKPAPDAAAANKPPPAAAGAPKAAAPKAAAPKAAVSGKKKPKAQFGKIEPLQLCFSPNAGDPIPFITLLSAVLLGIDVDLKLKMDIYRGSGPALGTHGRGTTADAVIQGDLTCARYFLSTHPRADLTAPFLGSANPIAEARISEWVEYATKAKGAAPSSLLASVDAALSDANSSFLVGAAATLADVAAFEALGGGDRLTAPGAVDTSGFPPAALRWFTAMDTSPAVLRARNLVAGIDGSTEFAAKDVLEPLVSGCHMLEGALPYGRDERRGARSHTPITQANRRTFFDARALAGTRCARAFPPSRPATCTSGTRRRCCSTTTSRGGTCDRTWLGLPKGRLRAESRGACEESEKKALLLSVSHHGRASAGCCYPSVVGSLEEGAAAVSALLRLLFCGGSGRNLGLLGRDPLPVNSSHAAPRARSHMCSASRAPSSPPRLARLHIRS
jgi:hypothetical protein